ncbi:hypothetical protein IW261DRAFT_1573747 [Armillaria novae-zelandiae]|uniref:Uncharacterized protein n=1 Tax=Armillaria novae-zelandiae TaxID=153914 RepID=A0AA39NN86_9AGAR|nr:hypothetical protein IW261DRAFT_1573747 [Armillaria novae-zelandiae]
MAYGSTIQMSSHASSGSHSQRIRVDHTTRNTGMPGDLLRLSPYRQNTCKTCYEQDSLSFITAIYIDGSGEAGYDPLFPSLLRRLVDEKVQIQTVILSHLTWSRIGNDAQVIIKELKPVQNLSLSNFRCAVEDFLGLFLAFCSLKQLEFERVEFSAPLGHNLRHLPVAKGACPLIRHLSIESSATAMTDILRIIISHHSGLSFASLEYLSFHGTTTVSVSVSNVVSKLLTLPGKLFKSSFGPIFVDNYINHTPVVFGYHLTELTITVEVKQYSNGYDFIHSLKWWGGALQSARRPNTLNTITFNLTIDKIMLKYVISIGVKYAGGWAELDDALGNPELVFQLKRLGFEVRGDIDPNWAQWRATDDVTPPQPVDLDAAPYHTLPKSSSFGSPI